MSLSSASNLHSGIATIVLSLKKTIGLNPISYQCNDFVRYFYMWTKLQSTHALAAWNQSKGI